MSSFLEKAKKAIHQNPDLFTVFEELDRTGKLRKASYKERYTFTIDESTMQRFRSFCQKNNKKMSTQVEALIKGFLLNNQ